MEPNSELLSHFLSLILFAVQVLSFLDPPGLEAEQQEPLTLADPGWRAPAASSSTADWRPEPATPLGS